MSDEMRDGARLGLLLYMASESEARWCAGWLCSLEEALKGDSIYDRLVGAVGGYWVWDEDAPDVHDGLHVRFVEGAP